MSEPIIAQNSPYVIECKKGRYAWCACGKSASQPYCDGSHKGTEFNPKIIDLEEDKNVAWCGCKQTCNSPYCDGTHSSL